MVEKQIQGFVFAKTGTLNTRKPLRWFEQDSKLRTISTETILFLPLSFSLLLKGIVKYVYQFQAFRQWCESDFWKKKKRIMVSNVKRFL